MRHILHSISSQRHLFPHVATGNTRVSIHLVVPFHMSCVLWVIYDNRLDPTSCTVFSVMLSYTLHDQARLCWLQANASALKIRHWTYFRPRLATSVYHNMVFEFRSGRQIVLNRLLLFLLSALAHEKQENKLIVVMGNVPPYSPQEYLPDIHISVFHVLPMAIVSLLCTFLFATV